MRYNMYISRFYIIFDILKNIMLLTFPDTVFSNANSFPAVTVAISSSQPGFSV